MKILAILAVIFALSMLAWFIWAFIVAAIEEKNSSDDYLG